MAKLHINALQGIIDVEGDEDFIREIYADFKDHVLRQFAKETPSIAREDGREKLDGTNNSAKTRSPRPKKSGPSCAERILALQSEKFFATAQPTGMISSKAQTDPFARGDLADAGKLHAFEIVIDASGKPVSTVWRDNGFKGPTPSGLSTADPFTKKVLDGKVVEGSTRSAEPAEFFGNTYAFDVTFRAAIAP